MSSQPRTLGVCPRCGREVVDAVQALGGVPPEVQDFQRVDCGFGWDRSSHRRLAKVHCLYGDKIVADSYVTAERQVVVPTAGRRRGVGGQR